MNRTARIFIKWMARLSLLAGLVLPALYCTAWRMGSIKYACGQLKTPAMVAHTKLMYSPFMEQAIDIASLLACLMIAYIFAELRYGSNTAREIKTAWQQMLLKWYLTVPIISFIVWILLLRSSAYPRITSWIYFGIVLSATVLLWKADFTAEPKIKEEEEEAQV